VADYKGNVEIIEVIKKRVCRNMIWKKMLTFP
jgi:hypothetical protein